MCCLFQVLMIRQVKWMFFIVLYFFLNNIQFLICIGLVKVICSLVMMLFRVVCVVMFRMIVVILVEVNKDKLRFCREGNWEMIVLMFRIIIMKVIIFCVMEIMVRYCLDFRFFLLVMLFIFCFVIWFMRQLMVCIRSQVMELIIMISRRVQRQGDQVLEIDRICFMLVQKSRVLMASVAGGFIFLFSLLAYVCLECLMVVLIRYWFRWVVNR